MASVSSRVVLIPGNHPPVVCGIGDYTVRLADELRGLGFSTTIWTRRQPGVTESATVKAVTPKFDAAGVRDIVERLYEEKPGLIHIQYESDTFDHNPGLMPFVTAAQSIGASLVTTFHALDGPKTWGKAHRLPLLPLMLGSRDLIVCSQKQFTALGKVPGVGGKSHLIPVGSAVPVTGVRQPRPESAPLRLIYFGFVWRGRNIETCIRAFAAVNSSRPATLAIVGGIKDAAYQREVTDLAASLGVADKITFTGDVPAETISQYLIDSDLALLPFATGVSTGRTTFVAAIEHGLPVVTMATPDNLVPEFRNNENMLYVPPHDTDGFVLETVRLAEDKAARDRMASNATKLANYFSWKEIARKTAALPSYQRLRSL